MKIDFNNPNIEKSADLEEKFFSIDNLGMVFDILRNKMYSNPILAICREYSCNARDSHREAGIPEIPIHIYLPNNLEQYYKIKDFGVGISPDRMENIFIKYTASTKRNDNIQTGGYGLGSKTSFSYTDSFSIITNYNGIQYNYNCFIDETKVGKLALASESPTKERNGTEIKIPVKPKNYNDFAIFTEQACRHWDVKPIVKGGTIEWQNNKKILEGTGWAITASKDWQRHVKMIIDGIEYPLELDALKQYADTKLINAANGNFIMYFGVGELSLSASREQIYLDDKTRHIIKNRLDAIFKEIKTTISDKIKAQPSLWLANIFYGKELKKAFNNIDVLGALSWKGIKLKSNYTQIGCPIFSFSKGKYSRKFGTDPNKLTRSNNSYISFEETSALFVNDLPLKEPTPRHVKKAFEDDPTLTSVQVICPSDKITIASLNASINLELMEPKLLSSITKATGRKYTAATNRLLVFKYDIACYGFKQVSYSSIEEDNNNKILCSLTKDSYGSTRLPYLKNKSLLTVEAIKYLIKKFPNYSFYGVDSSAPQNRLDEDFNDFEDIEKFIKEKVIDNNQIDYIKIKFATTYSCELDDRLIRNYSKLLDLIKNKSSVFLKRLNLHFLIKNINIGDLGLLSIYESVNGKIDESEIKKWLKNNPDFDINNINNEYKSTYPLLEHVSTYNYGEIIRPVAQYVNLIDGI